MAPKRPGSPTGDSRANAKLRGSLSWNKSASQPKFLQNAYAALSGKPASSAALGADGRPSIPARPEGDQEDESEEDEWDFGRGEEAPAVVVLKEGRHIDREEVDRLRAEAKATNSADPTATSSAPQQSSKSTGSLNFSSSSKSGSKPKATQPGAAESWEDVVQRAKADAAAKALSAEQAAEDAQRQRDKDEKRKKKDKKDAKKKIAMLSFDDE